MQPEEARGPVVARNLSRTLYRGEHYVLSVDSHTRFGCNWDKRLVALHLSLNQSRGIITAYPPPYDPLKASHRAHTHPHSHPHTHPTHLPPSRLAASAFHPEDNILRIGSVEIPKQECECRVSGVCGGAAASLFWAAGFNFARGMSVLEVQYDGRLLDLFWGEEILMALQLWTAGYDFYAPCDASLILHRWSRGYRPTFWQQRRSRQPPAATTQLLRDLLSLPMDSAQRTRQAYEQYANISLLHTALGPRALAGAPPIIES